jgi:hypothetical protein
MLSVVMLIVIMLSVVAPNAHVRSGFIPSLKITLVSYSRKIFTALAANLIISESILI